MEDKLSGTRKWSLDLEKGTLLPGEGAACGEQLGGEPHLDEEKVALLPEECELRWDQLAAILKQDDAASLGFETERQRKNIAKLLRVSDAPQKQTLVHGSVAFGATECLKIITTQLTSLDLDEPDADGRTPLHYAVERAFGTQNRTYLMCISILLEGRANVDCRDSNGDSIFHNILQMDLALQRNPSEYFVSWLEDLLRSKNVFLNAVNNSEVALKDIRKIFSAEERSERQVYQMICEKAEETSCTGGTGTCYDILQKSFFFKNKSGLSELRNIPKGYMGSKTILYLLAASKNLSLVDQALNERHDPWKPNVDDARLPLHSALESGMVKIVKRLLKSMKCGNFAERMNPFRFSLVQSVVAYASRPGTEDQEEDSNHLACFEVLLAHLTEVHPVEMVSGKVTVFELVCGHGLEQFKKLLHNKFPNQKRLKVKRADLEAPDVKTLLKSDDVYSLQIEFLRRGCDYAKMLYPDELLRDTNSLHLAAEHQAERCFEFLLNKCPSKDFLDLPDVNGLTVLHYAVKLKDGKRLPCLRNWAESSEENGNFGSAVLLTKELIRRGAFLDARDNDGNTALHCVAFQCKNSTYLATLFLRRILHALLEGTEADIDAINSMNNTPLDVLQSDIVDGKDSTLICAKILYCYGALIKKMSFNRILGSEKIPHVEKRDQRSGFSELLHLSFSKDELSVRRLLKRSEKKVVQSWETRYIGDKLTLYFFIDNFGYSVVHRFVNVGGNPRKEDVHGNIPLFAALRNGDYMTTEVLLESMRETSETEVLDLSDYSDRLFKCVYEHMAKREKSDDDSYYRCIELLRRKDVSVNVSSHTLNLCAETGDLDAMRLISRAEPLKWQELDEILSNNNSEKLMLELEKVGNLTELIMRPPDAPHGLTTLHAAFQYSLKENHDCFNKLLESISQMNSRFPASPDDLKPRVNLINEPDSNGETVLHWAVHHLAFKTVEKLLKLGADVNARDDFGNSPLHLLTRELSKKTHDAWKRTADALLASNDIDVDALNTASENPKHGRSPSSLELGEKIEKNVLLKVT